MTYKYSPLCSEFLSRSPSSAHEGGRQLDFPIRPSGTKIFIKNVVPNYYYIIIDRMIRGRQEIDLFYNYYFTPAI